MDIALLIIVGLVAALLFISALMDQAVVWPRPLARYFMQPFALWRAWIKNVPTFIGSAQPGRRG
jgi:hypothetical protein